MIIFYSDEAITIRSMKKEDAEVFYKTYKSFGYHPDITVYEKYFEEQINVKEKYLLLNIRKKYVVFVRLF